MNAKKNEDQISNIMNDTKKVQQIIQMAINSALLKHKQAGNAVCERRKGKIVWIRPEDIVINKN